CVVVAADPFGEREQRFGQETHAIEHVADISNALKIRSFLMLTQDQSDEDFISKGDQYTKAALCMRCERGRHTVSKGAFEGEIERDVDEHWHGETSSGREGVNTAGTLARSTRGGKELLPRQKRKRARGSAISRARVR